MARRISTTQAKAQLSALLQWAATNQDEVIVESHGVPKAVIIPFSAYEQYRDLREQARRKALLDQLEALGAELQTRNQDLTEDEAAKLADRFSRAVIEELIQEGKISYQGE